MRAKKLKRCLILQSQVFSGLDESKALFRSEIFWGKIPVALSLLFGKIYPTMN
jgi:hypothetical protein